MVCLVVYINILINSTEVIEQVQIIFVDTVYLEKDEQIKLVLVEADYYKAIIEREDVIVFNFFQMGG